jgi:hypothetical protein
MICNRSRFENRQRLDRLRESQGRPISFLDANRPQPVAKACSRPAIE